MVKLSVEVSEDVLASIDTAARESGQSRADVFREAIVLYVAASDGVRRGSALGFVADENVDKLDTVFVGL